MCKSWSVCRYVCMSFCLSGCLSVCRSCIASRWILKTSYHHISSIFIYDISLTNQNFSPKHQSHDAWIGWTGWSSKLKEQAPALEQEDCSISKISLTGTSDNGQNQWTKPMGNQWVLSVLHGFAIVDGSTYQHLKEGSTARRYALAKTLQHQTGIQTYPPVRCRSARRHLTAECQDVGDPNRFLRICRSDQNLLSYWVLHKFIYVSNQDNQISQALTPICGCNASACASRGVPENADSKLSWHPRNVKIWASKTDGVCGFRASWRISKRIL